MQRLEDLHDNIVQSSPTAASATRFASVALAPPDAIFHTVTAYKADTDPKKMNLGVGAYRTEEERPYVFNIVKKVER